MFGRGLNIVGDVRGGGSVNIAGEVAKYIETARKYASKGMEARYIGHSLGVAKAIARAAPDGEREALLGVVRDTFARIL